LVEDETVVREVKKKGGRWKSLVKREGVRVSGRREREREGDEEG
jgi:hypothetical protein